MQWHVDWLLRLAAEFYLVKYQTHQLQRMSYLQAVYETGRLNAPLAFDLSGRGGFGSRAAVSGLGLLAR